jgi:hypothetical protein
LPRNRAMVPSTSESFQLRPTLAGWPANIAGVGLRLTVPQSILLRADEVIE